MPRLISRCALFLQLCIALIAFPQSFAVGQQSGENLELPFELLSIDDGLSQGMVNCISQDHYGFMWFGTKDGLNRYDGLRFTVYRNNASDPGSLKDNYIQAIFEDSNGRLWMGTSREGLELLNRETETFYHFRLDPAANSASNNITKIQEDKDHNLWIGTSNGLFKITFTDQKSDNSTSRGSPEVIIKKYFENLCSFQISKSGVIYGTAARRFPFKIIPNKNGKDLTEVLPESNYYEAPGEVDDPLKFSSVVVEDAVREKIYFLYEHSFVQLDEKTGITKTLFLRSRENATLPFNAIVDADGFLWITTSGLVERFNPFTGTIKKIGARDTDLEMAASHARNIYECKSGIFWIGTMGYGVLKFNPALQKFNNIAGKSIGWMSPATNGKIITQTSDSTSINIFNPQSGLFNIVLTDSMYCAKMGIRKARFTFSAVQDQQGIYWMCKENLIRFDASTGEVKLIHEDGISGVPIFVDEEGSIWFSSAKAFSKYNPPTGKFVNWKYPFEITNEPYFFVQSIYRDKIGNFWLGTNNGVLKYNPNSGKWKNYFKEPENEKSLNNNIVFAILPDPREPERILWIGTNGGGLNRMDVTTGEFIHYTENEGLPNNVVYGILNDDNGNLWLSTNHGISRFDPVQKTFRNFDVRDGLQGNEFNRYAFCKDANGILYFGGINGLNYFHPDAISDNNIRPNIVITGIRLKNQAVSFKPSPSPLSKPAYLESNIVIPYNENMITFEFAALEFSAPRKNLYKYRLNGFDKDWILSGNTSNAIYTNLDPGEYTFLVRGSNNDGIWSDNEARISLVILAPWYLTWWFRIIVLTVVAGTIYSFYRYRLNQTIRLQELRNRIASDLHDEIGSTLSSISLYGEATKKLVSNNPDAMKMLTRINDNTQQMMEAMSDIVWTINTRHDRFDEVMSRMREYAIHAMEVRNSEVHFNEVPEISQISIDMNQRKNIYLIFKEAVNNAAKYSECKNLYVDFHFKKWGCIIKIRDDGKGFNPDQVKRGNGLYNMYKRTEAIKGDLSIHSTPGNGSEVVIKVLF